MMLDVVKKLVVLRERSDPAVPATVVGVTGTSIEGADHPPLLARLSGPCHRHIHQRSRSREGRDKHCGEEK